MEEHIKILKSLDIWKGQISVKELVGGMTNDNYLVNDDTGNYVARFAPLNTKILGLDQKKEIKNTQIAFENNIGPKVKKYYENFDLVIFEFIEGNILSADIAKQPDIIRKIAELFLKLHSLTGFCDGRSSLQRVEDYFNEIKSRNGWIPDEVEKYFFKIKNLISNLKTNALCPCHLDIMLENIIVDVNGNLKLIDWEYSENADPRYDLAMYIVKSQLNREQEEYFLSCCGITREEDKKDVRNMKTLVILAEAMYGILQNIISEKMSVNYKAYAESELSILKNLLE